MQVNEDVVRKFAYQIWESEGKPDGQAQRHWEMACKLAAGDTGPADPFEPLTHVSHYLSTVKGSESKGDQSKDRQPGDTSTQTLSSAESLSQQSEAQQVGTSVSKAKSAANSAAKPRIAKSATSAEQDAIVRDASETQAKPRTRKKATVGISTEAAGMNAAAMSGIAMNGAATDGAILGDDTEDLGLTTTDIPMAPPTKKRGSRPNKTV